MNAYDRWLTAAPEAQTALEQLESESANVETLATTSDGDAQEVLAVAIEYADDQLLGKIVREVLAGRSVDAEMKALIALGVHRVAEFNLARKS